MENSASTWYNLERGNTTPNSNTNPTNWTGYVGLMYPSDYAYTYAYGVDDTCFGNTYDCRSTLGAKSWLWNDIVKSSTYPWTLSPNSSYANHVFYVNSDNVYVSSITADDAGGVHPSIYLKSEIGLTGTGSSGDPYRIVE